MNKYEKIQERVVFDLFRYQLSPLEIFLSPQPPS